MTSRDTFVSRRHALLRLDEQGLVLEDMGSKNGTLVNGVRIQRTQLLLDGGRHDEIDRGFVEGGAGSSPAAWAWLKIT